MFSLDLERYRLIDLSYEVISRNLEALTRREFFFMALPFKVRGMDSGWARAIALEER